MDRPYAGPIGVNLNATSGQAYAPFRPTQLPGCVLWLRADLGVTKDGSDKVSQWDDQSGNGHHVVQATGARQPLWEAAGLGGKPSIKGDGVDDFLKAAPFTLNQPCTILMALQVITIGEKTLCDGNTNNSAQIYMNAGKWRFYAGAGGVPLVLNVTTSPCIVTGKFNGAASNGALDGVYGTAGNAGATNPGGLTLFDVAGAPAAAANARIGEVIVLSGVTQTGIDAAETYLSGRYGIVVS